MDEKLIVMTEDNKNSGSIRIKIGWKEIEDPHDSSMGLTEQWITDICIKIVEKTMSQK